MTWYFFSIFTTIFYMFISILKSKSNKTAANGKKRGGGFSKPCALSPPLQKFTGEPEMARTEKIWAEKDLQNPKNKRKILCDEMLHEIFRVKSIDMFQLNKALSKHICQ
ncbi:protein TRI1-like [Bidens hawaiensis]|uniref:protein TRI1-like n=1 Tax=Bidens hawaiensis TaxID=980011 RepID=UPI00404B8223